MSHSADLLWVFTLHGCLRAESELLAALLVWLAGIGVTAAKGVVWHDDLELRSESLVFSLQDVRKQAAIGDSCTSINT